MGYVGAVLCSEIKRRDGIEPLIAVVNSDQAEHVEYAVIVLINMSTDKQLRVDIVDLDVIPPLVRALSFR